MLQITERAREECLDDCLLGRALDGLAVGLILTNPAGRVIWMNRAAERVLATERSKCTGRLLAKILKDPQLAAFWHEARDCEEHALGEVSIHWPDACELKVNATNCVDRDGNQIGRALLFCDVTHERAVQIELSKEMTHKLLGLANDRPGAAEPVAGLTAQELRVLRHVGKGLGNKQIADRMCVSPSTIRTHLKHLYHKLGLKSRSEAVGYAVRNGIS